MVLGDLSLWKLLNDLVRDPDPDPDLVNPASIDVRVGREMLLEIGRVVIDLGRDPRTQRIDVHHVILQSPTYRRHLRVLRPESDARSRRSR